MNRSRFLLLFFLVSVLVFGCGNTREQASWVTWRDPILLRTGPAQLGPWRMNRSRWKYVDDPDLDLVSRDSGSLVWVNQRHRDVYYQPVFSSMGTRSREPVNVSRSPGVFSWLPEVVVNPRAPEYIYVLWQEIVFSGGSHGGEIFFSRSTDGGRTFESPINLSRSMAGDGKGRLNPGEWDNGSLDLALSSDGILYAAWTEYEGRLWLSRSRNRGQNFSHPELIAGGANQPPARAPSLATGTGSDFYLAWTVGGNPEADVRLQRLTPRGNPVGPIRIHTTAGHSDVPKIELGENDRVHLVYRESPGGPSGRYHPRYLQWKTDSGEFTRPVNLGPQPEGTVNVYSPDLELSERGNPYVLWEGSPDLVSAPRTLVFTGSHDGGSSFFEPIVVPGTGDSPGVNGSLQGRLSEKMDLVGGGYLGVVNSTIKRGERSSIRLFLGGVETGDSGSP